jgi:hypothetical protein
VPSGTQSEAVDSSECLEPGGGAGAGHTAEPCLLILSIICAAVQASK